MTMLRSPIRWAGGKSRLRRHIIPLMPAHTTYVEPFGGAAWVLLGKAPSPVEVYNDLDGELTNFFTVVRERPEALVESLRWTLVSRREFDALAATDPHGLESVARARRFFYLIMAGWGGELRYPRFQTAVKDAGGGNRLIGALKTLEARLAPVHARLQGVLIENLDYAEVLRRYDSPGTLFYLDPPYRGNGVNYRLNLREEAEHERLAEALRGLKGRWMVSAYDAPGVGDFYGGRAVPVTSFSGMRSAGGGRTVNREVVVCNFAH